MANEWPLFISLLSDIPKMGHLCAATSTAALQQALIQSFIRAQISRVAHTGLNVASYV
jgi:hypothetical protein